MRFDQRLKELLRDNDGAYLGEHHLRPAMRQALTELIPTLAKENKDLGTLAIELSAGMVDDMRNASSRDAFFAKWPGLHGAPSFQNYYELVQAGNKAGLVVMGYDTAYAPELEKLLHNAKPTPAEQDRMSVLWHEDSVQASSEAGMRMRDESGYQEIKSKAKGKKLVLGGKAHSGDYDPNDLIMSVDTFGGMPSITRRDEGIRPLRGHYQGIDARLGIPSIDFRDTVLPGGLGQTIKTSGKFNTYEVSLPEDLSTLRTSLWTPPVPTGTTKVSP
jgi:hypothetical protein